MLASKDTTLTTASTNELRKMRRVNELKYNICLWWTRAISRTLRYVLSLFLYDEFRAPRLQSFLLPLHYQRHLLGSQFAYSASAWTAPFFLTGLEIKKAVVIKNTAKKSSAATYSGARWMRIIEARMRLEKSGIVEQKVVLGPRECMSRSIC